MPLDVQRQLLAQKEVFGGEVRTEVDANVDFALLKNTRIREGKELQFRAEALNSFNHPLLSTGLVTGPTSATFGKITAATQAAYPRRLQLTLKYIF